MIEDEGRLCARVKGRARGRERCGCRPTWRCACGSSTRILRWSRKRYGQRRCYSLFRMHAAGTTPSLVAHRLLRVCVCACVCVCVHDLSIWGFWGVNGRQRVDALCVPYYAPVHLRFTRCSGIGGGAIRIGGVRRSTGGATLLCSVRVSRYATPWGVGCGPWR